jgi:hypothetical protein
MKMKKSLTISAILCIYVLLCGCPYTTNTPTSSPLLTPDNNFTLDNNILMNSASFPEFNHSTPITLQFTLVSQANPAGQNYNVYSLKTTGTNNIYQNNMFTSCTFSTIQGYLVMEVIDANNNHYFAVMVTNKDTKRNITSLNLLSLPLQMPVNQNYTQMISNYLMGINKGNFLPGTDGGYDNDSEIKGIAF